MNLIINCTSKTIITCTCFNHEYNKLQKTKLAEQLNSRVCVVGDNVGAGVEDKSVA